MILVILSVISVFATSLGPILAANTVYLSSVFHRIFGKIALLTGYFLLGVGVAGIICVPSARVWGKRHLFLLGTITVIFSSAWGGASTSYTSLLWARIFQGVGTAPFEALVNAAVGDLYFVHVRTFSFT
jgi:MFS family permease